MCTKRCKIQKLWSFIEYRGIKYAELQQAVLLSWVIVALRRQTSGQRSRRILLQTEFLKQGNEV